MWLSPLFSHISCFCNYCNQTLSQTPLQTLKIFKLGWNLYPGTRCWLSTTTATATATVTAYREPRCWQENLAVGPRAARDARSLVFCHWGPRPRPQPQQRYKFLRVLILWKSPSLSKTPTIFANSQVNRNPSVYRNPPTIASSTDE